MNSVLLVGGPGPTGSALVARLLLRGDTVTILHTGRHEREFSGPVEHLHADPRRLRELRDVLHGRTFDRAVSTSGVLVSVPLESSPCGNPFALRKKTVFDLNALRQLGYRDEVPVGEATRRAASWLAEHPVAPASPEERSLGEHVFDYLAEDRAIDVFSRAGAEYRPARATGETP